MQLHCRFRLDEETRTTCYTQQEGKYIKVEGSKVQLGAVQGEPFGSATPSGSWNMVIINEEAIPFFRNAALGQEYDIIITPVIKEE